MRGLSLHRGLSAFRSGWRRALLGSAFAIVAFTTAESQAAGSIFITGHDPDFHASLGGNALGAQRINQVAISFIQDQEILREIALGGDLADVRIQAIRKLSDA